MKLKSFILKILLIANFIFLCIIIFLKYPDMSDLKGTYEYKDKDIFISISFDRKNDLYYLYDFDKLLIKDSFHETNDKRIFKLNSNKLNNYIILENNSFYLQVSEGKFIKLKRVSPGITFYGK